MQMILGARLALAAVLALSHAPRTSDAQAPAPASRSRTWNDPAIATLMLVDDLGSSDARAIVIRRPGDMPNNIVLVTRTTSAAELASAVSALITSRRSRGDQVDREIRALIGATPRGTLPAAISGGATRPGAPARSSVAKGLRSEPLAAADLHRLRAAPEFTIPGIGRGPALVIRMRDKSTLQKR
jgi:hypothetical protein